MRILDIGCGTGLSDEAVHAAKLGTEGSIIGVDISAELLPLAMAKGCCENGVVGNSDESLALDAGSFDAIIFVDSSPTWKSSICVSTRWFAWLVPEPFSFSLIERTGGRRTIVDTLH